MVGTWEFIALILGCLPFLLTASDNHTELPSSELKVVCYFINWAWNRAGEAKYLPEDVDPFLCTHILYAFATLNEATLTLQAHDVEGDIKNYMFQRATGLKCKNPDLKVLLSLGGWVDSEGGKYSELVNDPEARKNFTSHVIPFLNKYNFDGLDLDWEYPRCWQGNCTAGPESDKANFALWLEELRSAFDQQNPRLLLTAAVISGNLTVIDGAYDVPSISRSLDFINVMAYDMYGDYYVKTRHHAQMYPLPGDPDPYINAVGSMEIWHKLGCPTKKLIMGMPAYSRSFLLANPEINGLGAPTIGPGKSGNTYFKICQSIKSDNWTVVWDELAGPYMYKGNVWMGYSDPKDAARKAQWVRNNGYGGVMVWETSHDDIRGKCCRITYPYLKAMNYGLRGTFVPPEEMGCP